MALPRWAGRKGRPWLRLRAEVLRESLAAGIGCVWCGHAVPLKGHDVNHDIPRSIAPHLAMTRTNLSPIHGRTGCPECGRKCNQELGPRIVGAAGVQSAASVSFWVW